MRVKQLICGSLSGMSIRQSLTQPCIPQMMQRLGAELWGLWRDPRVRAAIDCGEIDEEKVREEFVVQNACGGKPGSHGSKVILLSHA